MRRRGIDVVRSAHSIVHILELWNLNAQLAIGMEAVSDRRRYRNLTLASTVPQITRVAEAMEALPRTGRVRENLLDTQQSD